jgi:hypothetical protein
MKASVGSRVPTPREIAVLNGHSRLQSLFGSLIHALVGVIAYRLPSRNRSFPLGYFDSLSVSLSGNHQDG